MTQYTQGPWDCDVRYFKGFEPPINWAERDTIVIFGGGDIAYVSPANRSDDECLANARLIAAAPDLLEALEEVIAMDTADDWRENNRPSIRKARAAIAKARGQL